MELITVKELNSFQFYKMPKAFTNNPKYIPMSAKSKIIYSILMDLLPLSAKNGWFNEKGEVFVKLSREKLMARLRIGSKTTITNIMKELAKYELILEKQVGQSKCNEIYIAMPEDLGVIYSDDELLELDNEDDNTEPETHNMENEESTDYPQNNPQNFRSTETVLPLTINRSTETVLQEVQKMDFKKYRNCTHIKTNNNKTNYIETNCINNSSSSSSITNTKQDEEEKINDDLLNAYVNCFEKEPNKFVRGRLLFFQRTYDVEVIIKAIEVSAMNGANSWSYVEKVINDWKYTKGINSLLDLVNAELELDGLDDNDIIFL